MLILEYRIVVGGAGGCKGRGGVIVWRVIRHIF